MLKLNIKKLEAERLRLNQSKRAFAESLGLTANTYIKIIAAESTTIKTIAKIGDALHIDPRDLLTR